MDEFLKLRSLEMFVVAGVRKPLQHAHWKRLEEWVREKRRVDKRVFFVEVPAMDIQAEWEEEMRGGESIWDRAFRYTTKWEARERAEAARVRIFAWIQSFNVCLFCQPSLRHYKWQMAAVWRYGDSAEM